GPLSRCAAGVCEGGLPPREWHRGAGGDPSGLACGPVGGGVDAAAEGGGVAVDVHVTAGDAVEQGALRLRRAGWGGGHFSSLSRLVLRLGPGGGGAVARVRTRGRARGGGDGRGA